MMQATLCDSCGSPAEASGIRIAFGARTATLDLCSGCREVHGRAFRNDWLKPLRKTSGCHRCGDARATLAPLTVDVGSMQEASATDPNRPTSTTLALCPACAKDAAETFAGWVDTLTQRKRMP